MYILESGRYEANISLARIRHHRRFAGRFAEWTKRLPRPDAIVASMPIHYTAAIAGQYAKRYGIPLVLDVRDMWPDTLVDLVPEKLRPIAEMAFWRERRVLRAAVRNATCVTSMMEDILDWVLNKYGGRLRTPWDRVFYIGAQSVDAPGRSGQKVSAVLPRRPVGNLTVGYVGTFGHFNNPRPLLEACRILRNNGKYVKIDVLLAGHGQLADSLKREYQGFPGVYFLGWCNHDQLNEFYESCDIGIVPWSKGFAFPNKAFNFLRNGIPVATTARGDMLNLLEEHKAGYGFDYESPEALADIIHRLSTNRQELRDLSSRALSLFNTHLCAKSIYRQFATHIENVIHSCNSRSSRTWTS